MQSPEEFLKKLHSPEEPVNYRLYVMHAAESTGFCAEDFWESRLNTPGNSEEIIEEFSRVQKIVQRRNLFTKDQSPETNEYTVQPKENPYTGEKNLMIILK